MENGWRQQHFFFFETFSVQVILSINSRTFVGNFFSSKTCSTIQDVAVFFSSGTPWICCLFFFGLYQVYCQRHPNVQTRKLFSEHYLMCTLCLEKENKIKFRLFDVWLTYFSLRLHLCSLIMFCS